MVFAFNEISNYAGRPAYIFEFVRDGVAWRYTSADRDVVFNGNTHTAAAMKCGSIRQTGEPQSDEFTISGPATLPFTAAFLALPPSERVRATVRRFHLGDTDAAVRWSGFVDRIKRVSSAQADIICKGLTATLRRAGVRLPWQRQCPHALFDSSCKVNKAAYANSAVIESLNGLAIVAAGLAAAGEGRLQGGFIEWTTPDGFRAWRAITAHGTNYAELLGGTVGLDVGTTVVAYPSCPRNADGCNSLFNNLSNFGGFRHLPSRSPYDGNPVF